MSPFPPSLLTFTAAIILFMSNLSCSLALSSLFSDTRAELREKVSSLMCKKVHNVVSFLSNLFSENLPFIKKLVNIANIMALNS